MRREFLGHALVDSDVWGEMIALTFALSFNSNPS
jgi:hypothetical protein